MRQTDRFIVVAFVLLAIGCGQTETEDPSNAIDERSAAVNPTSPDADSTSPAGSENVGNDASDDGKASDENDATAADGTTTVGDDGVAQGDDKLADADFKQASYATPQECFKTWQQASENKDIATTLSCLSISDRYQRVGWYAYYLDREILFDRENAQAAKDLLKANDIEVGRVMHYVHEASGLQSAELAVLLSTIGQKVERPSQFAVDAAKLVEITIGGAPPPAGTLELRNLKIRGNLAIGTTSVPETGADQQVYFKRTDDSWLITTNP